MKLKEGKLIFPKFPFFNLLHSLVKQTNHLSLRLNGKHTTCLNTLGKCFYPIFTFKNEVTVGGNKVRKPMNIDILFTGLLYLSSAVFLSISNLPPVNLSKHYCHWL